MERKKASSVLHHHSIIVSPETWAPRPFIHLIRLSEIIRGICYFSVHPPDQIMLFINFIIATMVRAELLQKWFGCSHWWDYQCYQCHKIGQLYIRTELPPKGFFTWMRRPEASSCVLPSSCVPPSIPNWKWSQRISVLANVRYVLSLSCHYFNVGVLTGNALQPQWISDCITAKD